MALSAMIRTKSSSDRRVVRIDETPLHKDPVNQAARKKKIGTAMSIIAPVLLLLYWQLGADNGWFDARVFSSPTEVVQSAKKLISNGSLAVDLAATLRRLAVGYGIGAVLGILIGIILGWSVLGRSALRPVIAGLQTLPTLGILPIFLMIFGLGELPIYLVTIKGMIVLMSLATMDAVSSVPTSYLEAARSMNSSRFHLFFEVVVPSALGRIFTGLRVAVGLGVLSIIGMEFVVANEGIGRRLWTSWNLFQPGDMFVALVIASLMGVTLNGIIGVLQRIAMPWQRDGDRVM